MRQAIDASLRKGRFTLKKGTWSVASWFVKVGDSSIWVYTHQGYVTASSSNYMNFQKCVDIKEATVLSPQLLCHALSKLQSAQWD